MALHIGQKRNIDYSESSFQTDITSSTTWSDVIHSRNIFGQTENWNYSLSYFEDCGFVLNSNFSSSKIYYFTLALERQENEIVFDIKLQNGINGYKEGDPYQILKKCTLNVKIDDELNPNNGKYDYYDLVFVPNRNDFNTLVLCINRDANDILDQPKKINGLYNYHLYSLTNLIDPSHQKYWKKMGIQSRPGSLIVVNKEPIRIGRSGIYELNNGTKITSLMIASGWTTDETGQSIDASVDPFLIDYVYQTNESGGYTV